MTILQRVEEENNPYERYLTELFSTLAANKALPKYQFERRVDAMLGLFLPELLLKVCGWQIDVVLPEFPIKKSDCNQSTNVDYLLYRRRGESGVGPAWIFFELKTDVGSVCDAQLDIYLAAMQRGFAQLRRELEQIIAASKATPKYELVTRRLQGYPEDGPIELVYLHPGYLHISSCPANVHLLRFCDLQDLTLEHHAEVWDMFRRLVLPKLT
jgi:hypothetical protein